MDLMDLSKHLAKELETLKASKKTITVIEIFELLNVFAERCAHEYVIGNQDSWNCFRNYALNFVKKYETNKRKRDRQ